MGTRKLRILVLPGDIHGMPINRYAEILRDRLPDHEVHLANNPRMAQDLIPEASIVTGKSIDTDLLGTADNLQLFACLYAGTDHLPLESLAGRGVRVTNASGVHGPNVAETVIGMILIFARRLLVGFRRHQRREWRHFQTHELYESTVTIVGLGSIGSAIAERLAGFGVETIGVRYSPKRGGPTDEVIGYDLDDIHDALARTDYLVLSCPLTDTTEGLIDAAALAALPSSAIVINVARGPVIDTTALVRALRFHGISGAGLDVTDPEPLPSDHPLWAFENVFITPHNAGHTPEYYERAADILVDNVHRMNTDESIPELRNQVIP